MNLQSVVLYPRSIILDINSNIEKVSRQYTDCEIEKKSIFLVVIVVKCGIRDETVKFMLFLQKNHEELRALRDTYKTLSLYRRDLHIKTNSSTRSTLALRTSADYFSRNKFHAKF